MEHPTKEKEKVAVEPIIPDAIVPGSRDARSVWKDWHMGDQKYARPGPAVDSMSRQTQRLLLLGMDLMPEAVDYLQCGKMTLELFFRYGAVPYALRQPIDQRVRLCTTGYIDPWHLYRRSGLFKSEETGLQFCDLDPLHEYSNVALRQITDRSAIISTETLPSSEPRHGYHFVSLGLQSEVPVLALSLLINVFLRRPRREIEEGISAEQIARFTHSSQCPRSQVLWRMISDEIKKNKVGCGLVLIQAILCRLITGITKDDLEPCGSSDYTKASRAITEETILDPKHNPLGLVASFDAEGIACPAKNIFLAIEFGTDPKAHMWVVEIRDGTAYVRHEHIAPHLSTLMVNPSDRLFLMA